MPAIDDLTKRMKSAGVGMIRSISSIEIYLSENVLLYEYLHYFVAEEETTGPGGGGGGVSKEAILQYIKHVL